MNIGLDQTGIIIKGMTEKITTLTQKLDSLNGDEKFEMLAKALSQDPVTYGEFLSSPVKVSTHQVYETANYGSAVAPFYTTLALWVGGLLLTALIKVHPDKDELTTGLKAMSCSLEESVILRAWSGAGSNNGFGRFVSFENTVSA